MLPVSVASLMPLVLICLSKRNTSHGHTKTVGAHAQIRIIKTTFSNLIFCLSVIRCFLTATEKCILLIFISFVLLCVCVEVRAHIPSGAHPIRARKLFYRNPNRRHTRAWCDYMFVRRAGRCFSWSFCSERRAVRPRRNSERQKGKRRRGL